MSEKITHTAVLDDSFRLCLAAGGLCPAFQAAMRHRAVARLGSGTRAGDRHSVQLLTTMRKRWSTRTPSDQLEAKLAFVLGWLCHRAADRQMKPIFRALNPDWPESPTECSVYHDAFLFRELYAVDADGPYSEATVDRTLSPLQAAKCLDVAGVRTLFHTLLQQALIEIHTFAPDEGHIETWLEGLIGLQQGFYVNVDRYAQAIALPDPEKVRRYVTAPNFYDRGEPVIAMARRLQRGEETSAPEVRAVLEGDAESHYAQALQTSCRYLAAANAFFLGEMTADKLRARLDIGKRGRDGKPV